MTLNGHESWCWYCVHSQIQYYSSWKIVICVRIRTLFELDVVASEVACQVALYIISKEIETINSFIVTYYFTYTVNGNVAILGNGVQITSTLELNHK